MTKSVFVLSLILASGLFSSLFPEAAHALPLTSKNWNNKSTLGMFYTPGFNFEGIIALSNCSASLVRFKNSVPTEKAMMLTNGHCVSQGPFGGFLKPGEVLVNKNASMRMSLLDKSARSVQTYEASRILFATMTNTDVGLYELTSTYSEIKTQTGVDALTISDQAPAMGMDIQIPSGYWKRTYACQTEAIIPALKEADWTFKQSIRFSQPGCETIGGTSGSPLVNAKTGEIIGINNTGNEDGEQCTMNNPCEVDEQGHETVRQGRSYGQETYWFYGCLAQSGTDRIDLNQAGCQLPKP